MKEMIEARRIACPIWDLDDWVLEHHDVVTLCSSRRLLSGSAGPCANPQKFRARTRKKCVHIPETGT